MQICLDFLSVSYYRQCTSWYYQNLSIRALKKSIKSTLMTMFKMLPNGKEQWYW